MEDPAMPSELGPLLAWLRKHAAAGITQETLAHRAGISPGMVAHVERGTRSLSMETLEQIAEAMSLRPELRDALVAARSIASARMSTKGDVGVDERTLTQLVEAVAQLQRDVRALAGMVTALSDEKGAARSQLAPSAQGRKRIAR